MARRRSDSVSGASILSRLTAVERQQASLLAGREARVAEIAAARAAVAAATDDAAAARLSSSTYSSTSSTSRPTDMALVAAAAAGGVVNVGGDPLPAATAATGPTLLRVDVAAVEAAASSAAMAAEVSARL
eukprot:TRINITY_DN5002_c2_g1_i1.p1 TRINITY_DN5002_c2_g1~~TRINITY_DN5002_c2_g1_i1.p1  ORF type:complete len:147 (+),score=70.35 TRINITY_DN5002_c2_g1_i1:50-442(+)